MLRQRAARGLRLGCCCISGRSYLVDGCIVRRLDHLQFLEPQFQLLDLMGELLRGAAKLHAPEPRDLDLELLDLQALDKKTGLGGGSFGLRRLQRCSLRSDERAKPRHLVTILSRCFDHEVKIPGQMGSSY